MKFILDICKRLVDTKFIYNLSSSDNCDKLHLFGYYLSNMEVIDVLPPHLILFLFLVGFMF